MVTAIIIPIICLYFFWITRKEMKEQDQKWLSIGKVRHEAVLTGQIIDLVEERQRFYYHRYIYIQEMKLQTGVNSIKIKKVTPVTKNLIADPFTIGETIRVYGKWEGNHFFIDTYEVVEMDNEKR